MTTDPVREALKELLESMRMDASDGGRAGGSWDEAAATAAGEVLAATSASASASDTAELQKKVAELQKKENRNG